MLNVLCKATKLTILVLLDFVSRTAVVAPSSVRPLTQVSQKPLHGSRRKFVESYLQIFTICFFVFVHMGPYGSENFKTLLLSHFWSDFNQTL